MENVASFLQYGSSPMLGQCGATELRRWEPTEEDLKAKEAADKRQRAKDMALCTISTAEKLVISGLDVDEAFTKAEELVEKSKSFLASKTENIS